VEDETSRLAELRERIDGINLELLQLLSRRAQLVHEVAQLKERTGREVHDPERELSMLAALVDANRGPLPDHVVAELFQDIFRHSRRFMEHSTREALEVARTDAHGDAVIEVKGHRLGEAPVVIAGPSSVESREQLDATARFLASRGVRWFRGGAWKPRTSPYDFQGLGEPALELLAEVGDRYGLATVTEVVDARHVALAARRVDVLQVGARNMQNFELLTEVGRAGRPVLLERGPAATLQELLKAAD
jgi:3-deoxy-7-phosphoheptulonate synthase/chorismate mutase